MTHVHFILDDLSVDTKLVLVNAIYFKSPWKHPFKPEHTQKAPFYLNAIENTVVDMMVTQAAFASGTLQGLNAKVVSLAYKVPQTFPEIMTPPRPCHTGFNVLYDLYCRVTVSACK